MTTPFTTADLSACLDRNGIAHDILGDETRFTAPGLLDGDDPEALVWSKSLKRDLSAVAARTIIVPAGPETAGLRPGGKTFVAVEAPRKAFALVLSDLFAALCEHRQGFDDATVFSPGEGGHRVGRMAVISDRAVIGRNAIIHPGAVIYGNVVIGDDCEIGAGSIIGAQGYGYIRSAEGTLQRFPHIGGVVLGDRVTIGANTCVDSGGLSPTRIEEGSKIGNFCQIAHNVRIGRNCLVAGRVQVGGSTTVGEQSELWPSVVIANGLKVGRRCDVKMGSVVVTNLPDDSVVSGNFAIPHENTLRRFARERRKS